jgi:hypothetical protein
MRWVAVVWLAVWLPAYAITWGWWNFTLLCNIAVILTCVGLWRGSALLLSSQAVATMVIEPLWTLDVAWRLVSGAHLIGGTEYMWDPQYPLWVRLLSGYHVLWPVLVVWATRRVGYDPRGFWLQSGLAVVVMILSRLGDPVRNANMAFRDPIFQQAWGPAPAHIGLMLAALIFVIYWPTHQVLLRALPSASARRNQVTHV